MSLSMGAMPPFHEDSGGVLCSFAPGWPVEEPTLSRTERLVQAEPVSQAWQKELSFDDLVDFKVENMTLHMVKTTKLQFPSSLASLFFVQLCLCLLLLFHKVSYSLITGLRQR